MWRRKWKRSIPSFCRVSHRAEPKPGKQVRCGGGRRQSLKVSVAAVRGRECSLFLFWRYMRHQVQKVAHKIQNKRHPRARMWQILAVATAAYQGELQPERREALLGAKGECECERAECQVCREAKVRRSNRKARLFRSFFVVFACSHSILSWIPFGSELSCEHREEKGASSAVRVFTSRLIYKSPNFVSFSVSAEHRQREIWEMRPALYNK